MFFSFTSRSTNACLDILFVYCIVLQYYYGAVLPRRRPHHVLILSVCLSVPCLHLEGKRKGLQIPNLVGRVTGTPAPRGPISRSRGQRSRSRRMRLFYPEPTLPLALHMPFITATIKYRHQLLLLAVKWIRLAGVIRILCRLSPGDLVAMATAVPSVCPYSTARTAP